MATKLDRFAEITAWVASLEATVAAISVASDTTVSSQSHTVEQVHAIQSFFAATGLNGFAAVKVGSWFRRTPLVDILPAYPEFHPKDGEEAYTLTTLMARTMKAIRLGLRQGLPGINHFCAEDGIVAGAFRFQGYPGETGNK